MSVIRNLSRRQHSSPRPLCPGNAYINWLMLEWTQLNRPLTKPTLHSFRSHIQLQLCATLWSVLRSNNRDLNDLLRIGATWRLTCISDHQWVKSSERLKMGPPKFAGSYANWIGRVRPVIVRMYCSITLPSPCNWKSSKCVHIRLS